MKYWITFNEPYCVTYLGYGVGSKAPGMKDSGTSDYIAAHNLLRAHAKAYRLYERDYKETQQGRVGITLNVNWDEPENSDAANQEAADRNMQFSVGWFANPIFGDGNYPRVMIDQISRKSMAQGNNVSRLPEFTSDELSDLKGSADFFGLNFYTSSIVRNKNLDDQPASYYSDKDTEVFQDGDWFQTASYWLRVTPWGLRKMLKYIKDKFNNPDIIITENGVSDRMGYLDDAMRINYYKYYINNVLKAIKEDDVKVFGYTAWSLMDNFEWERGYSERFGLHYIDFTDPERPRVPKNSARYFASLIKRNGFVAENFDCDSSSTDAPTDPSNETTTTTPDTTPTTTPTEAPTTDSSSTDAATTSTTAAPTDFTPTMGPTTMPTTMSTTNLAPTNPSTTSEASVTGGVNGLASNAFVAFFLCVVSHLSLID